MQARRSLAVIPIAACLVAAVPPAPAEATGIVVDTLADAADIDGFAIALNDEHCSLREAVTAANTDAPFGGCPAGSGADTITFSVSGTIHLAGGGSDSFPERPIRVESDVTIDGGGQIVLRGDPEPIQGQIGVAASPLGLYIQRSHDIEAVGRAFLSDPSAVGSRVHLSRLAILDARIHNRSNLVIDDSTVATDSGGFGEMIFNEGRIRIDRSTLHGNGNGPGSGGGIVNAGDAVVVDSTITGNSARSGGGIYNSGNLTVQSSTIAGNAASTRPEWPQDAGGGVFNDDGTLIVRGSIVAGNAPDDIDGRTAPVFPRTMSTSDRKPRQTITDSIVGLPEGLTLADILDPAGLADNGGPTETIALVPSADNPAIDAAAVATCAGTSGEAVDQRGLPRPVGTGCDLGAYELQEPIERPTAAPSPSTTAPSTVDSAVATADPADDASGAATTTDSVPLATVGLLVLLVVVVAGLVTIVARRAGRGAGP